MLAWSTLFVVSLPAKTRITDEHLERPSLEVEETSMETADRADRATDHAVRMLDHVNITSRAKSHETKGIANDTLVTAKVKLALVGDERVKGRHVMIETQNGTVILRGSVNSVEAKIAAEEITKGVEGIRTVKNTLQIFSDSEGGEERDDVITEKVNAAFRRDLKLKKTCLTVRTVNGVVSLSGAVSDVLTGAHAAWTAWKVRGVRLIRNDLTVNSK
jgi:hyperosmotically inducible protein